MHTQKFKFADKVRVGHFQARRHQGVRAILDEGGENIDNDVLPTARNSLTIDRRTALITTASSLLIPLAANADSTTTKSVEDVSLGNGIWKKMSDIPSKAYTQSVVPAYFATYAARFLLNYDQGISSWWRGRIKAYSLFSREERQRKLGKSFASLARSLQIALDNYIRQNSNPNRQAAYTQLLRLLLATYDSKNIEIRRQIGLLFAMLPPKDQPNFQELNQFATQQTSEVPDKAVVEDFVVDFNSFEPAFPVPDNLSNDFGALLPGDYIVASVQGSEEHRVYPPLSLFEVGFAEEFGQTAVGTPFGPLSASPLARERPQFSPSIYALFGVSGAAGCALTHSVVIPLDVVKTRAQTNPDEFSDLLKGASKIVEREGVQGLFLGAQATLAGYSWYGLSVYPSYTASKRFFTYSLLPPEVANIHVNDIALLAGACSAVIASIGLTPLEAARIRVVAEPESYRSLGLSGTLGTIASEDPSLGWKGLYAGFPSLLARQVIFGSVKFLAFERACDAIFAAAPYLRDATWTSLGVSLVAGGIAGVLSSVVSQPADSILTYVARENRGESNNMGLVEGARTMIEENGLGSLFNGLGSRCVWAGSIIAGQFLLYDIFRAVFSVTSEDLSQVYEIVLPTLKACVDAPTC